jgi:hypothetical protein
MIGNLDWSATGGPKEDSCCHNARLIGVNNEAVPRYGVPYDFDSSGLVNAHYASPPNGLKMRNIRQRLYRGFCAFNGELPQTAVLFNEKKAEFLVYRMYNLLTKLSFRVRPMIIEYKDSKDGDNSITRFSFLIEDIDDVAKRNDFKELSIAKTPYKKLDPAITSKLSIFQFMIGNLDWAATSGPKEDSCCHNSRLIGVSNEAVPRYGIPYDFDSSGLVNAHYASPPNGLKMRNIRQRLYRGFCAFNDELPQTAELFNEKKADILALFENNSYLNDRTRKDAINYIEDFYKILNNPKRFKRDITDKCRGQG